MIWVLGALGVVALVYGLLTKSIPYPGSAIIAIGGFLVLLVFAIAVFPDLPDPPGCNEPLALGTLAIKRCALLELQLQTIELQNLARLLAATR